MKLTSVPENWLERLALWLGIAPTPLSDTHVAFMMARTLMVAAKTGIFEALAAGSASASSVAHRCNTHQVATKKILNSMVHLGYLKLKNNQYHLTKLSRKWMLQESESSIYDKMMFQFVEWKMVEHYENYLREGKPLELHKVLNEHEWETYQKGMRSMARISGQEVGRRTPVPNNATQLLDIGGSHGYYSIAICKNHPALNATILDLPEAITHAAPLLAEAGMKERVRHQSGNVLDDDLGEGRWDVIFISSLVHHFSEQHNQELAEKASRALRPKGYYVIQEYGRPDKPRRGDHLALLDFFFAATSESGTWSEQEMKSWMLAAGLKHHKTINLRTIPGHVQVIGKK
jgi:predicted O-methyltransferase YrrM/predicted transcriptional regulator